MNLVGGSIEPGETPHEAAIREMKEETGLDGDFLHNYGRVLCSDGSVVYCFHKDLFESDGDNKKLPLSPREGEQEKIMWVDRCSALTDERLIPNLKIIIPLLTNWVSGWTLIDKDDGQFIIKFVSNVSSNVIVKV